MIYRLVFILSVGLSSTWAAVPNTMILKSAKLLNVSAKQNLDLDAYTVDLSFDTAFKVQSISPVFERNFIQFVFSGVKIDSARIVQIPNTKIEKIFVYAFNPETVRVRIIFNEAGAKNLNRWNSTLKNINSKTIRITLKAVTESTTKFNEASLLKEIVQNTPEIDIHNPDSVKDALNSNTEVSNVSALNKSTEDKSIGTKADPTKYFIRMAISLMIIVTVFLLLAFLFKKYATKLKKLPFGKKDRLIQIIATHYLGNKKSMSLIKVAGEFMVIGVSNEGISLITKLGPEVNVEKYLEDRFWGGTFEKHLNQYSKNYDGVQDLNPQPAEDIRKTIREKLSKMKPLN